MAADLAPTANGMYGSQYGQPAELAAPVPSSTQAAAAPQPPTEPASTSSKQNPQEVGWYFVEQYYTTLSKQPDRIHLFYNKPSQLVTGIEAEKVLPAVGQKAINDKIKELDIQDCKVRVLNVDSQDSLDNIVVQVIGVMSNKSAPSKKFVQTFVLTPQINGYYVLNDIFRYLNDEEDEIVEDDPVHEPVPVVEANPPPPPAADIGLDSITNEDGAQKVDAKLEEVINTEAAPAANGDRTESVEEVPVAQEAALETLEEVVSPEAAENPPEPDPTPVRTPPKANTPAPAADIPLPPSKKTWANLVGSKATVPAAVPIAAQALPKAQKAPTPPPSAAAATTTQPLQSSSTNQQSDSPSSQVNEWQTADHSKKQIRPQKPASEGNVQGYIKNVTNKIENSALRDLLNKYGLKFLNISRAKNCAFVEFEEPSGFNAAVAANPHKIGSEQIFVEERRPGPPNAFGGNNPGFNRGGAHAGRGRGGSVLPGRTGSQSGNLPRDAGRGSFQQRGGKTGNVTPKGRGQVQAL